MKSINLKEFVANLNARTALLQPNMRAEVAPQLKKMAENSGNEDARQKFQELLRRVAASDQAAFSALNEIRVKNINNFVLAGANAITFFDTQNLADGDVMYLNNTTGQEVKVYFIGVDGRPTMTQIQKEQAQTFVPLRMLTSEEVEYKLMDIYKGSIEDEAKAQVNVSYDMQQKVNTELWNLVKARVGSFLLSGPKHLRTFVLHSSIVSGNLPTTNLIELTSNTDTSLFRLDAIKAVIKYCSRFGSNSFPDGALRPVTFYVPSADVADFIEDVDVDSVDNALTQQIFESGFVLNLAGYSFNVVGDSTLDPAAGLAYVRLNKPLGTYITKSGLDRMFPQTPADISADQRKINRGSMYMQKVHGATSTVQEQVNVVAVRYRNAA